VVKKQMPSSIENYAPQTLVRNRERQAFFAWGAIFFVALFWVSLILAAPIFKTYGYDAFSNSIYTFFGYLCHQISVRSFHYGEYPFAVCARCFGFYSGFFLGLVAYPLVRRLSDTDSFPRIWLFLAMIPMGVDWSLGVFGIWENTHLSRLVTGAILGAACAFFIVPALVEINHFLCDKFERPKA
jgi:uncharacterized membrane protein